MLIGIDQGTTGTMCVAVDQQLQPLAQAYRRLASRFPKPGWVEQEPEEVTATVQEAVAAVLARLGERAAVDGVGLANQGETVVAWDLEGGNALSPAVVWSDVRSEGISRRLAESGRSIDVRQITGLRLDPYFSAPKMAWLLENDDRVRAARTDGTLALGTLDSWIAWRQGGRKRFTDHSTGSRTLLMNLAEGDWDQKLLELFGVPRSSLGTIVESAGDLGTLFDPAWKRELPWRASLVDQPAALLGNACTEFGDTKVTYGTGCFVLINAGFEPPDPPDGLLAITAWSLGGVRTYALEGGVFTAGTAIEWLQEIGVVSSAEETADLASSVSDAGGVRFLPALTGLGSPWWRSDAKGHIGGLTAGTTRAHLCRAVLDSIAFRVRDVLQSAWAAGVPRPATLRVDGGLSRNRYLMQRQADILGIPVQTAAHEEATAVGAAALAGLQRGMFHLDDIEHLLPAGERFVPRLSDSAREGQYDEWLSWVRNVLRLDRLQSAEEVLPLTEEN